MHPAVSTVEAALDAQGRPAQSRRRLLEILEGDETLLDDALAAFSQARVVVHFHPDRLTRGGRTVAQGLLADGRYRSQFDTGHSNGSRTAFVGGVRDQWEEKLFHGAYQCAPQGTERPKYGAIEIFPFGDGPAPRFGSCYFVLRQEVAGRCTFCVGDSHMGPVRAGTAQRPGELLLGLLERSVAGEALMGRTIAPRELTAHLRSVWIKERPSPLGLPLGRTLDDYFEAQVHGSLNLVTDMASLVVDDSFRGHATGEDLEAVARRYGFPLLWRPGFQLDVQSVPDDFRGPAMPPLARRIVPLGQPLTARAIGEGALSLERSPEKWSDWPATYDETWQQLKQLWHVLVEFGSR